MSLLHTEELYTAMFTYVQGDREYRMLATEATYSTNQLLTGRENQMGFKNSLLLTAKKSKTELLFFPVRLNLLC